MSDAEKKVALAIAVIREEIGLLLRWADESGRGGWSTHQVEAQRERAASLALTLYQLG